MRVDRAAVLSKDRHKSVAQARHVCAWLLRYATGMSFPELGRNFGNRDHTTMMSSVKRIDELRERDLALVRVTDALLEQVKPALPAPPVARVRVAESPEPAPVDPVSATFSMLANIARTCTSAGGGGVEAE